MFVADISAFREGDTTMISCDGFRYTVGRIGVDIRTMRPQMNAPGELARGADTRTNTPHASSEWEDPRLAAALNYLADLEADANSDELAIVAASHEVMLRRRALAEEIAWDS
jgi:hypothetical protein